MRTSEAEDQTVSVIAIRVPPALLASVDHAAAREGLSRADIVRRATIRDLARGDGGG